LLIQPRGIEEELAKVYLPTRYFGLGVSAIGLTAGECNVVKVSVKVQSQFDRGDREIDR
jgi:hypothetical protein